MAWLRGPCAPAGTRGFLSAIRWLTPPTNFWQAFGFVCTTRNATKYFVAIADRRFRHGKIRLPAGGAPEIEMDGGDHAWLEMLSGFEKRSFGIAFSLTLAEMTRRRIPLVIDTPLGNADSAPRHGLTRMNALRDR